MDAINFSVTPKPERRASMRSGFLIVLPAHTRGFIQAGGTRCTMSKFASPLIFQSSPLSTRPQIEHPHATATLTNTPISRKNRWTRRRFIEALYAVESMDAKKRAYCDSLSLDEHVAGVGRKSFGIFWFKIMVETQIECHCYSGKYSHIT